VKRCHCLGVPKLFGGYGGRGMGRKGTRGQCHEGRGVCVGLGVCWMSRACALEHVTTVHLQCYAAKRTWGLRRFRRVWHQSESPPKKVLALNLSLTTYRYIPFVWPRFR
ncbi:unnamed protein product, partial [Ectocarpus sp. 12 AP-2014]